MLPIPGTFHLRGTFQFKRLDDDGEEKDRTPQLADPAFDREIRVHLTRFAVHSMRRAQLKVKKWHHAVLTPTHLLLGILEGAGSYSLLPNDLETNILIQAVEATLSLGQESEVAVIPVSENVLSVITAAKREAHERGIDVICRGYQWVGCGPLFLGLLREGDTAAYGKVLTHYGLTYDSMRTSLPWATFFT
ncbi:hypothetical protein KTT_55130 [Tengunoibacter tsumagoiensis]|uniref:Clp R domain-containing protein n=2 Tax=Tengunoibacter tsumagoiensis TaxID=2014871 RepID=A0A402A8Z5_9CHLR|nr:hypothetical protein KTT_55130 [Tengunoibacter tsumagoiensis]